MYICIVNLGRYKGFQGIIILNASIMAEKKTATKKTTTAKTATVKTATPKAATKKAAPAKKTTAKESVSTEFYVNSYTAGFRAGDVYQALATADRSMTLEDLMATAKISKDEALLGIGWLLKEGKIEGDNVADLRLV